MVPDHRSPGVAVACWKRKDRRLDVASVIGIADAVDQFGHHLRARRDTSQVAQLQLVAMRSHDTLPCVSPRSTDAEFELSVRLGPGSPKCRVRAILSHDTLD